MKASKVTIVVTTEILIVTKLWLVVIIIITFHTATEVRISAIRTIR